MKVGQHQQASCPGTGTASLPHCVSCLGGKIALRLRALKFWIRGLPKFGLGKVLSIGYAIEADADPSRP